MIAAAVIHGNQPNLGAPSLKWPCAWARGCLNPELRAPAEWTEVVILSSDRALRPEEAAQGPPALQGREARARSADQEQAPGPSLQRPTVVRYVSLGLNSHRKIQWFSTKGDFPPEDTWQFLEPLRIVMTRRWRPGMLPHLLQRTVPTARNRQA